MPDAVFRLVFNAHRLARHLLLRGRDPCGSKSGVVRGKGLGERAPGLVGPAILMFHDLVDDPGHFSLLAAIAQTSHNRAAPPMARTKTVVTE